VETDPYGGKINLNYTKEQQKAIFLHNKSLLVSAAAGSGKTAVLVERIIELVSGGMDIDKLLVVTFTNLAASEMRERIYKAITKKIKDDPQNKNLKKQLLLMPCANIKTIHSFCLDIIKNNINMIDIPLNFRIADDMEGDILKQRCIEDIIEDKYLGGDTDFCDLMDTYGYGRNDARIIDLILAIYNFSMSLSDPENYYNLCIKNIELASIDFTKTVFCEILTDRLKELLEDNLKKYEIALSEINARPDLLSYYDTFLFEYDFIKELLSEKDFLILQEKLLTFSFARIPSVKKGTDNAFVKQIRDDFKGEIKKFNEYIALSTNDEHTASKEILKYIKTIIELTKEFSKSYSTEKLKKSIIDFSDFEHLALFILTNEDGTPSEIAQTYKNTFREILIDEYQDTNDVQDKIFNIISRNGENLFMVGDVKQSIYKFRQAKPEIFINKREIYRQTTDKLELISLAMNFRSRDEVLSFCNQIFTKLMTVKTAMTDYKTETLIYSNGYKDFENSNHKTEILIFDKSEELEIEDNEDLNKEACVVANRIKELMADENFRIYDTKKDEFRRLEFSDIVILSRSLGNFGQQFFDTLKENGIRVTADFSEDLFSAIEVKLVIAILKAIDNPLDDISLLALLKSPIFNFSETELLEVRQLDFEKPLFYALKKSDTLKAISAVNFLDEIVKIAYTGSISHLLNTLYKDLKIKEIFSAFKNSEQRLLNLDLIYDIALSYEKTDFLGLKSFIIYLEKAEFSQKTIPSATNMISTNSVKIMSIHKSKGLEFPVVFVSGLGRRFNNDDLKQRIIVHPDFGMGVDYIDIENRFTYQTLTKNAFKIKIKDELMSEELRVLYVALTRAKEKLILTASLSNYEKSSVKWKNIVETGGVSTNTLLNLNSFIDYIMPTVLNTNLFDLEVYNVNSLAKQNEIIIQLEEDKDDVLDDFEQIFYDYKYKELASIPAKITVSAANKLKRQDDSNNVHLEELDTMKTSFSGSEYGTYFHKLFELIDIDLVKTGKTILELTDILIEKDILELKSFTYEIAEKIEMFFKTDVAKNMLTAQRVYKEKPFLIRIPANEIYKTDYINDIILQGTIDCYFVKDDKITLIDFKTDKKTDENFIKENYSEQMKLYAYAIGKIEDLEVATKIIYTSNNNNFVIF
jgi:ATP-dependent helicase/nuclease subunit A